MAIKILYPKAGTDWKQPTVLPRQFVAIGTKVAAEMPLGVMISLDTADKPDGKYRIGGETIVFKPDASGTTQEPTKWALSFRIPTGVGRHQRFVLAVLDSEDLPTKIAAQNSVAKVDHVVIKKHARPSIGHNRFRKSMVTSGILRHIQYRATRYGSIVSSPVNRTSLPTERFLPATPISIRTKPKS